MDLRKMSVDELKVLAWEQLVMVEATQNNLKVIRAELSSREQVTPTPAKKDKNPGE